MRVKEWNQWASGLFVPHQIRQFIHLEYAKLNSVHLEYGKLNNAHLEHAELDDVYLECAELEIAHFEHAKIRHANLKRANLLDAHFEHAQLYFTNLEHANLQYAHLEHAKFPYAHMEHANLEYACFDGADVRKGIGLLFDANPADRLLIEGNAPDPWSVLRRKYPGPWFFVHLLMLILFLAPYVEKMLYLSGVSQVHRQAMVVEQRLEPKIDKSLRPMRQWYWDKHDQYIQTHAYRPAIWVLIGGTRGAIFVGMAVAILFYNLIRGYLTLRVGMLRDAEERSRITPSLEDYYGLCHPLSDDPGWINAFRVWGAGFKRNSAKGRGGFLAIPGWMRGWRRRWASNDLIPPPSLIDCLGLYRLHQIAAWIFWISMASFVYSAVHWIGSEWVWVPV